MTSSQPGAPWFVGRPNPGAKARVVCLPYAGRGASAFHGWDQLMGPDVEVVALQLGARESRWREAATIDIGQICGAFAELSDLPYLIYGHSLGGRLGYEMVRELQRRGHGLPQVLVVGASGPVDLPDSGDLVGVSRVSDAELVRRVAALGGIPDAVLADDDLVELLIPAIRGDFAWIDDYRWVPGPALPIPILALSGQDDGVCPPLTAIGWSRHSTGGFALRTVPGSHFFLHEHPMTIRDHLRAALFSQSDSGELPAIADDEVRIEFARESVPSSSSLLTEAERDRAARFQSAELAERFVFRRSLVRQTLQHNGFSPHIEFDGEFTKPHTRPPGPTLSWSHRDSLTLVGVACSTTDIGVDIETIRDLPDLDAIGQSALTEQERWLVAQAANPAELFLDFWTAKEAVLKATGDGLSIDPTTIDCHQMPTDQPLRPFSVLGPRGTRWWVHRLRLPWATGALAAPTVLRGIRFDEVEVVGSNTGWSDDS